MEIKVAKKLIVLSTSPGTVFLIPGSGYKVTLFPTRFYLEAVHLPSQRIDLIWTKRGDISEFRSEVDLERGRVEVGFRYQGVFYRLGIAAEEDGLNLYLLKGQKLHLESENLAQRIELGFGTKYQLVQALFPSDKTWVRERLSLGCHKTLDLQKLAKRQDLEELLPIWYTLAQWTRRQERSSSPYKAAGVLHLVEELESLIEKKEDPRNAFLRLSQAGLPLLIPRLFDQDYLGFTDPDEPIEKDLSPFLLLQRLFPLIRSLFFKQEGSLLCLLPTTYFPQGRLLNLDCQGSIDLEWSQKQIKKAIFRPKSQAVISIKSHPSIRTFRVRQQCSEKGHRFAVGDQIEVEPSKIYLFDRFQK